VRLIGAGIEEGERLLRRPGQTPSVELTTGAALTFGLLAAVYLATAKTVSWTNRSGYVLGFVAESFLAWTCLASRSLQDESSAVVAALEAKDIVLARQRLARIVGRDTQHLDANEISRAVIETVAESCSDGVIAPLFYLAIGGVPFAMAYKTINTLDSMIGHTDERYLFFGKVAARLDDAANFLPARLTALGFAIVGNFEDAIYAWRNHARQWPDANEGVLLAAGSGALGARQSPSATRDFTQVGA